MQFFDRCSVDNKMEQFMLVLKNVDDVSLDGGSIIEKFKNSKT